MTAKRKKQKKPGQPVTEVLKREECVILAKAVMGGKITELGTKQTEKLN